MEISAYKSPVRPSATLIPCPFARRRVPLEEVDVCGPIRSEDVLALDETLERLASFAPLQARIIEMRFFAGMTTPELARALDLSESTIERHWRLARAWLRSELEATDGP